MYSLLLFIHIVSSVLSIGPFFVLFPTLKRMEKTESKDLSFHLEIFAFVVRLSKHSGHVLVTSGVLLMWIGNWSIFTSWIVVTLIILLSILFFIARAFSPTLRQLRDGSNDKMIVIKKLRLNLYLYVSVLLIMMWFMVAKPSFW